MGTSLKKGRNLSNKIMNKSLQIHNPSLPIAINNSSDLIQITTKKHALFCKYIDKQKEEIIKLAILYKNWEQWEEKWISFEVYDDKIRKLFNHIIDTFHRDAFNIFEKWLWQDWKMVDSWDIWYIKLEKNDSIYNNLFEKFSEYFLSSNIDIKDTIWLFKVLKLLKNWFFAYKFNELFNVLKYNHKEDNYTFWIECDNPKLIKSLLIYVIDENLRTVTSRVEQIDEVYEKVEANDFFAETIYKFKLKKWSIWEVRQIWKTYCFVFEFLWNEVLEFLHDFQRYNVDHFTQWVKIKIRDILDVDRHYIESNSKLLDDIEKIDLDFNRTNKNKKLENFYNKANLIVDRDIKRIELWQEIDFLTYFKYLESVEDFYKKLQEQESLESIKNFFINDNYHFEWTNKKFSNLTTYSKYARNRLRVLFLLKIVNKNWWINTIDELNNFIELCNIFVNSEGNAIDSFLKYIKEIDIETYRKFNEIYETASEKEQKHLEHKKLKEKKLQNKNKKENKFKKLKKDIKEVWFANYDFLSLTIDDLYELWKENIEISKFIIYSIYKNNPTASKNFEIDCLSCLNNKEIYTIYNFFIKNRTKIEKCNYTIQIKAININNSIEFEKNKPWKIERIILNLETIKKLLNWEEIECKNNFEGNIIKKEISNLICKKEIVNQISKKENTDNGFYSFMRKRRALRRKRK